ncbi:MAG: amidohydrolase [Chloroflexi bacterium]|nr:amidohydrolase [Chloroflexota bacterium]
MSVLERTYGKETSAVVDELLISSDSHVIEPEGLWRERLPEAFLDRAPGFGGRRRGDQPGAMEGSRRVGEMAADGVSAEVLYPTHGLKVLSLDDPELEAACARVYNDWLIDYCGAAPDRLIGLAMLSMYDVKGAIEEMERARKEGLHGAVIWQVPAPALPFTSDHYERFWAAAQDLEMPVNLHILSGHGYSAERALAPAPAPADAAPPRGSRGIESERRSVNRKLSQAIDSLYDLIFSGVLERFPRLKVVLVENEIGWMPFVLEQWDYYFKRHGTGDRTVPLSRLPSEFFHDQVYATFFNDAVGGHLLSWWGTDNCMWSNDYPHGNSTWPHSREIVARDLGSLPAQARAKVLRENVARLYHLRMPEPVPAAESPRR